MEKSYSFCALSRVGNSSPSSALLCAVIRILPQTINLKKTRITMAIFCYWAVCIVVSWTIDAGIPSQKEKSICDWLTIYLSDWGCGRNEIFWQWAMRFHGLLCIRTDGMSTDYSSSLSYSAAEKKKKTKQLAIHTAHSSSSHTHITTNFVRVQVRSIIKKNLPRLSRIGSFVLYL